MAQPLIARPSIWRRSLLLFISDLHLTDVLAGPPVPWEATFERFWQRVAGARGDQPAELCIVGDFVDIVRSPTWFETEHRPYHEPNPGMLAVVDRIVAGILTREQAFFTAIRGAVQRGELKISYVLGNHDRLLAFAPTTRRMLWAALTGEDREVVFDSQKVFPEHGVLAYHGHRGDFICSSPDNGAPVSDIFGAELIVRFPDAVRARVEEPIPHLDDIDDVRPLYAVPAWIRQISGNRKGLMRPVSEVWSGLVEEFLENPHFHEWIRRQRKIGGINPGAQLKRILGLSTGRFLAKASDKRLTRAFRTMQNLFDGKFAQRSAHRLDTPEFKGLRYVVNGHSHFPSMTPLGTIQGNPAVYFNSGTWRTVHQIGTYAEGRPTFLPYSAMCYIAFFPDGDAMNREFEWWTGAMVTR